MPMKLLFTRVPLRQQQCLLIVAGKSDDYVSPTYRGRAVYRSSKFISFAQIVYELLTAVLCYKQIALQFAHSLPPEMSRGT